MTAVAASPSDQHKLSPRMNGATGFSNGDSSNSGNHNFAEANKRPPPVDDGSDDDVPLSMRQQQPVKKIKQENPPPAGSFEAALTHTPVKPKPKPTPVVKKESPSDSEDDIPLSQRKQQTASSEKKKRKDEDDDYCPVPKKKEKLTPEKKPEKKSKHEKDSKKSAKLKMVAVKETPKKGGRKAKKEEEEEEIWKWWEEEKHEPGVKWKTLEHKGPVFAPEYEPLPKSVRFKYNGEVLHLQPEAEEVATFYARMLDHEYTTKDDFNKNFFKDWRKTMTAAEREKVTDLTKCDFREIAAHFMKLTEERKAMTKEEKLKIKEVKDGEQKVYGFAMIDGHKQKIGNFRIEPPGLFRGRG
uniref:DNA topoisomerase I DNA binding eukaryotic-type domain-containing protein n=1 Tax=Plectus sambesii TaxID=2011161 RepID=A0A914XPF7_9BILA